MKTLKQNIRFLALCCFLSGVAFPVSASHSASEPSDGTVRSFKPVVPPKIPTDIQFYSPAGDVSLSSFKGKVVLLNIWATWCPPCIRELPSLDRLQAKFDQKDFQVLPLSVDDGGLEQAAPFFARLKIKHLKLHADPAKNISRFFPIDVLPASFIIDKEGQVIAFLRSYADWDEPQAEQIFRDLVNGKKMSINAKVARSE